jgi:hypothetical protein
LVKVAAQLAASGHHISAARVLARAWIGGTWDEPLEVLGTIDMRAVRRVIEEISRNHVN